MSNWWDQFLPLCFLPDNIRDILGNQLDVTTATGLGYPSFASELLIRGDRVYQSNDIDLIRERAPGRRYTRALLQDYAARGGTIQGVQRALVVIGHVAQNVIPTHIEDIERFVRSQQRAAPSQYAPYPVSGLPPYSLQQTEPSQCNCPQCWQYEHPPSFNGGQHSQYETINPRRRESSQPLGSLNPQSSRDGNRGQQGAKVTKGSTNNNNKIEDPLVNKGQRTRESAKTRVTNYFDITQRDANNTISCSCEKCRQISDPDQTQRLTLESEPKAPCHFELSFNTYDKTKDNGNVEPISEGLSQLYLDSSETSPEDFEDSDETFAKSVYSDAQHEPEAIQSKNGEMCDYTCSSQNLTDRKRLCSKSDDGTHFLGERINNCSVCRNFLYLNPTGQRYSSDTKKTEVVDKEMRRSWHGPSKNDKTDSIRKMSSDSVLDVHKFQNPRFSESACRVNEDNNKNSIESTLFCRISHEDDVHLSPESRTVNSSHHSNESVSSESEFYQNNFSGSENDLQIDSRNINPSYSLNCSSQLSGPSFNNPDRSIVRTEISEEFVFVTYSWNGATDRESFIKDVIAMSREMNRNGIRVKIDMDQSSFEALRLNKLDWIDRNVREAKYVIVCLTPTYAMDIREPDQLNQAAPRISQLNTRYIYEKLRNEFYNNQSQNRRTIPVMFTDYGTTDAHIPSCMRSTMVYKYPQQHRQIVASITGGGRYQPS